MNSNQTDWGNQVNTVHPDSGVFAIDKPEGFTSFDVVAKLRGILGIRKIGHGGTLDPMATGVLPIFLNKATRVIDLIADSSKRYLAKARFGLKTDTGDITGRVIEESNFFPSEQQLSAALVPFLGPGMQLPPMYSAVKVNGKRLYDIARSGKSIARTPREVQIYSITLIEYFEKSREFTIDVNCSKGVYIRSLVEDIAESLGAVSTLTALRRTKSGPFVESDCIKFEDIQSQVSSNCLSFIKPVDILFTELAGFTLSTEQFNAFTNGVKFVHVAFPKEGVFKVYYGNRLLALSTASDGYLKSLVRFV